MHTGFLKWTKHLVLFDFSCMWFPLSALEFSEKKKKEITKRNNSFPVFLSECPVIQNKTKTNPKQKNQTNTNYTEEKNLKSEVTSTKADCHALHD